MFPSFCLPCSSLIMSPLSLPRSLNWIEWSLSGHWVKLKLIKWKNMEFDRFIQHTQTYHWQIEVDMSLSRSLFYEETFLLCDMLIQTVTPAGLDFICSLSRSFCIWSFLEVWEMWNSFFITFGSVCEEGRLSVVYLFQSLSMCHYVPRPWPSSGTTTWFFPFHCSPNSWTCWYVTLIPSVKNMLSCISLYLSLSLPPSLPLTLLFINWNMF